MKPVLQTMFYDATAPKERQRGNCLTAVVASLLELPIENVPNFVQCHVDTDGGEDWWASLLTFVERHGYHVQYVKPAELPLGTYYTAAGVSPRGDGSIRHIVICQDGRMVHDPHPDADGLLTEETFWALYPCAAYGHSA